jgi:hypothetical protein
MGNENESVKLENTEEAGSVQDKKHGFASHSPGTWDQDEMISDADKAKLPPKEQKTKEKA